MKYGNYDEEDGVCYYCYCCCYKDVNNGFYYYIWIYLSLLYTYSRW